MEHMELNAILTAIGSHYQSSYAVPDKQKKESIAIV